MPYLHPKTWDDGVMPLEEFPVEHQRRIADAVAMSSPPPRFVSFTGGHMESRAWHEWHWARGRKLRYIPGPGRRKLPRRIRLAVIERDGYVCGICDLEVDPADVHIDHIHPVSRGGTDDLDNLRVTHSRCNIRKGAKV